MTDDTNDNDLQPDTADLQDANLDLPAGEIVEPEPSGDIDDDDTDDDAEDDEGEEQDEQAEAKRRAQDEKEIEARYQRLGNENARHARRVSEIMADDATALIQCPVCMDGIAGWIYPPDVAPLPDEAVARIRQVIGLPDLTTFEDATDASQCPACKGLGKVKTGSNVPGYEVKECGRCASRGWISLGVPVNGAVLEEPAGEIMTGPTVYPVENDDPQVRQLRQRGFTVIPPMQPVGAS